MLTLILLLILFFIAILIYQIILANSFFVIEGLDNYKPYDTNNPQNALILAQQNAGNIQVLKDQLGDISGVKEEVKQNTKNVTTLQGQIMQIVEAQKEYTNNLTGGTPPDVTGT
jgi:hypothetical protein